jgi:hypothetical protein
MDTVLTIVAIIAGPILAVQAQKWLERMGKQREEKRRLFLALMATRGRPLVADHVQALNMLDVIFSGKGGMDRAVVEAWREYRDHLNDYPREPAGKEHSDAERAALQSRRDSWSLRSADLLVELLVKMAESLGYHYDRTLLRKGAYIPQGYDEADMSQLVIRRALTEILIGVRPLPIRVVEVPPGGETRGSGGTLPEISESEGAANAGA